MKRSPTKPSRRSVEDQLLARLSSLPYLGFEAFATELLALLGYTSFEFTGRKSKRGRKSNGSVDFFASIDTGVTPTTVIVQIKQYKIQRQFIDVLRGAMPRHNASQAIILSTHEAGKTAREVAKKPGARPVLIIDGPMIASLMIEHGLGVRVAGSLRLGESWYELNEEYFEVLKKLGRAAEKAGSSKQQQKLYQFRVLGDLLAYLSFRKPNWHWLILEGALAGVAIAGLLTLLSIALKHLFHLPIT